MFFQNIPRLFFEILIIVLLTILILVMIKLGYNFDEIFIKVAIFSASAFRIMPSINRLTYTYQGIVFSSSTLDKISSLSKEISKVENFSSNMKNNKTNILDFKNEFQLSGISFKYDKNLVLNNLNLKIKKGEAIGIYGFSGGGKTTLINLVAGLIKPQSGKIILDNKEVEIDNSNWQNLIGYVPQSVNLLDDTIINNITFCENIDGNKKFLMEVANQAQISELIDNYGDKIIGERGL